MSSPNSPLLSPRPPRGARRFSPALRSCAAAALLVVSLLLPSAATAQEITWRHDYNAARKEAAEKNRPLVIDFGTENCFWCKRLDASTFRDPGIISLMNERFIPLKIDADRESTLASSLHIQSYPTVVLASADGKIIETMVGFKEAPQFQEILQRALGTVTEPDWMVRDFGEASKAVAASDYARAVSLLKTILEDGKDRPVQAKAKQMLRDVEQQAAGQLAKSKQLDEKGETSEALKTLTELIKTFPGTQAGTEAGSLLTTLTNKPEFKAQQRAGKARELLAQAREDYRTQQYLCCLDRCEMISAGYGDLPEGSEAAQLASEIKNNPEWMQKACENASDRLSLLYLSLAETWIRKGQPQQAAVYLERVVALFPGTRQAEAAQVRLAYLKGGGTVQAEFKKP